jgi:hypothetical protein
MYRSLARFLSVDKFAAPKSPTFHTATVTGNPEMAFQDIDRQDKTKHTVSFKKK